SAGRPAGRSRAAKSGQRPRASSRKAGGDGRYRRTLKPNLRRPSGAAMTRKKALLKLGRWRAIWGAESLNSAPENTPIRPEKGLSNKSNANKTEAEDSPGNGAESKRTSGAGPSNRGVETATTRGSGGDYHRRFCRHESGACRNDEEAGGTWPRGYKSHSRGSGLRRGDSRGSDRLSPGFYFTHGLGLPDRIVYRKLYNVSAAVVFLVGSLQLSVANRNL